MLTVMCPNCRHHFPAPTSAPVCYEQSEGASRKKEKKEMVYLGSTRRRYVGDLLVPRDCINGLSCTAGGCVVNASTIVHGSSLFQPPTDDTMMTPSEQHVATMCKFTCGSVTTRRDDADPPDTLSDSGFLLQKAPYMLIQSKLTSGGCLVQERSSVEDERPKTLKYTEDVALINSNVHRTFAVPLNSCLELPRSRGTLTEDSEVISIESRSKRTIASAIEANDRRYGGSSDAAPSTSLCQCHERSFVATLPSTLADDRISSISAMPVGDSVQIRVNSTIQLPVSLGQWKVNVTSMTTTLPPSQVVTIMPRARNHFSGGGIVTFNKLDGNDRDNEEERTDDDAPTSPVSWLMPCPWTLDTYHLFNNDADRLSEVRRVLQTCGWYYEGMSCQQSANLLKHAPVGRWLMRDSSDERYHFAVSVQTARGSTSIRIHYFLRQFRLDAEPRLALAMPLFDSPIEMLEHYVEYSKRIDNRTEAWVDNSGQLYNQIYLTKPLIKEVRSLSHLARLTINRNKLPTEHLPLFVRNYLAEYPYTL